MSSVQPPLEYVSRAARLDRILRELLQQTPGVEAAAVVSFDGLPMASALPAGMDEDRVAAMSAALLSLAERAAQGLGRGDLSQVYIEGENGTVFLVSAQDEAVLIAVTAADTKVGMMLYEVKLAANRVGEVLRGPAPLPAPLPSHVTRSYLDEAAAETDSAAWAGSADAAEPAADELPYEPAYVEPEYEVAVEAAEAAEPAYAEPPYYAEPAYSEPAYTEAAYTEPAYSEPAYSEPAYSEPAYSEPAYSEPAYSEPAYSEPAYSEAAYTEPAADSADEAQAPEAAYPEVAYTSASALTEPYFAEVPAPPAPPADPPGWSSYAPTGSVLPGQSSWS
jgi:predicted regulator of Ras-like GTPase activity (Roadblock/LC7/MglB family)